MRKILLGCFILLLLTSCSPTDNYVWEDEPVELTILVFQLGQSPYLHIGEYVNKYTEKYPEVDIKVERILLDHDFISGRNYDRTFQLDAYIEEFQPDIVELWPIHRYLYQDQFVDLNQYFLVEGLSKDDFYPALLDAITQYGELLALPIYYDMNLMYYSKEAFERTRIPFPQSVWTWEELLSLSDDISIGVRYSPPIVEQIVRSYGAHLLSPEDFSSDGYLNSEETKKALQWMMDHMNHTNDDYAFMNDFRFDSEVGMTSLTWTNWHVPTENDPIAIIGVPYAQDGERINPIVVSGLGIWNGSEQQDAAWHFLKETLVEDNEVSQLVAQKNLMSTRKSVSASSGFDQTPIGQVVIEELAYAVPSSVKLNYVLATLIDKDRTQFLKLKEGHSIESIINPMIVSWEEELRELKEKHGR